MTSDSDTFTLLCGGSCSVVYVGRCTGGFSFLSHPILVYELYDECAVPLIYSSFSQNNNYISALHNDLSF